MASAVKVRCPNGRLQTVKISPSTKLWQVVQQVCEVQKYTNANEYSLKRERDRNLLDLTLPFRYTNLPNNALLELTKLENPCQGVASAGAGHFGKVTVALQTEEGRLQPLEFSTSLSVWNVLLKFQETYSSAGDLTSSRLVGQTWHHPVCVYMQEGVGGEPALKKMTLALLGLVKGRAVIRLSHEAISLVDSQIKADSLPDPSSQPVSNALIDSSPRISPTVSASSSSSSSSSRPIPSENANIAASSSSTIRADVATTGSTAELTPNHSTPRDTSGGVSDQPLKAQRKRDTGEKDQGPAAYLPTLSAPSIFVSQPSDRMSVGQTQPYEEVMEMDISHQLPLMDFKFPDATKGKKVYSNELSEVAKADSHPCDREVVVYNSNVARDQHSSMETSEQDSELSESFFQLTERDAKILYQDMRKNLEESPLLTQSMRAAQREEIYSKYSRAVLRFLFPDGMALQAKFRPRETVHAVKKFLADHIEGGPAIIYTTPPKRLLKDDALTLIQAELVPMSLVYVGNDTVSGSVDPSKEGTTPSLSAHLLANVLSVRDADEAALDRNSSTLPSSGSISSAPIMAATTNTSTPPTSSRVHQSEGTAAHQPSEGRGGSKPKMPKWYKGAR